MRKSRALKYGIPAIELHKPELHNTQCSIVYAAQLLAISRQIYTGLLKGTECLSSRLKGAVQSPIKTSYQYSKNWTQIQIVHLCASPFCT